MGHGIKPSAHCIFLLLGERARRTLRGREQVAEEQRPARRQSLCRPGTPGRWEPLRYRTCCEIMEGFWSEAVQARGSSGARWQPLVIDLPCGNHGQLTRDIELV
jgi:hypothetical protein